MAHLTVARPDIADTASEATRTTAKRPLAALGMAWQNYRKARLLAQQEAAFLEEGGVMSDATERRLEARLFGLR